MEFVHKADSHRCCVKGCARAAICPIPNGYIGELLQFGNHKHHILCGAHHRAVLRAMKVFSLPPLSPFYSSHIYLQSKEHHHEHASAHHEDAMEVDSHDSEQSHAHPLKPFGDLKGHQQWTRVNRFAGSVWETIVNAAMDIMHCESLTSRGLSSRSMGRTTPLRSRTSVTPCHTCQHCQRKRGVRSSW